MACFEPAALGVTPDDLTVFVVVEVEDTLDTCKWSGVRCEHQYTAADGTSLLDSTTKQQGTRNTALARNTLA